MGLLHVFIVLSTIIIYVEMASVEKSNLHCFHCTIVPPGQFSNETTRLCANFDYSERYVVHCPYSTMCMKKTFEYPLLNGDLVKGTTRDCAPQKYDHQVYKNGKWEMQSRIEEDAYVEGCQPSNDKGARSAKSEYCYCSSYLCNSAQPSTESYSTDAMAVIFVFNAMKYIQSYR